MDKNIKPFWYIEIETLVTILQVIRNLDGDLKRKIIKIIVWYNKRQVERYNIWYNDFDNNLYDTSDWHYSD